MWAFRLWSPLTDSSNRYEELFADKNCLAFANPLSILYSLISNDILCKKYQSLPDPYIGQAHADGSIINHLKIYARWNLCPKILTLTKLTFTYDVS